MSLYYFDRVNPNCSTSINLFSTMIAHTAASLQAASFSITQKLKIAPLRERRELELNLLSFSLLYSPIETFHPRHQLFRIYVVCSIAPLVFRSLHSWFHDLSCFHDSGLLHVFSLGRRAVLYSNASISDPFWFSRRFGSSITAKKLKACIEDVRHCMNFVTIIVTPNTYLYVRIPFLFGQYNTCF